MQLNLGQWVVIGVCALLILGYIRGYFYNRRRARQILSWLQEGLSSLGEITSGKKLPGMVSGGQLEVNTPSAPLRRVEVVYLLTPRENLLFYVFYLLQGRRDELIVWINFQSKPEQAVEVARHGDRQFAKRFADKEKPPLSMLEGPRQLQIAAEQKPGTMLAGKVQSFLQRYPAVVLRMALRPEKPHLFLRADLRLMRAGPASDFFSALSNLLR